MKKTSTYTTQRIEVQCICRSCGKEFWRMPANVKAGGGQYCTSACANRAGGRRNSRGRADSDKIERDMSVTRVVTTVHKSTKGTTRARKYELSR